MTSLTCSPLLVISRMSVRSRRASCSDFRAASRSASATLVACSRLKSSQAAFSSLTRPSCLGLGLPEADAVGLDAETDCRECRHDAERRGQRVAGQQGADHRSTP